METAFDCGLRVKPAVWCPRATLQSKRAPLPTRIAAAFSFPVRHAHHLECACVTKGEGGDRTRGEGDLESGQAIGVAHIEQPAEFVVAVLVLDVVNGGLYDLMAAQFLVCSPL